MGFGPGKNYLKKKAAVTVTAAFKVSLSNRTYNIPTRAAVYRSNPRRSRDRI